jgi:hypothetical protein
MKPDMLREKLAELGIHASTNLRDDLVLARADGRLMHFRAYPDGKYDWAANQAKNPIDLLDFRTRDERPLEEAIEAAVKFVNEGKRDGGSGQAGD